ncbi:MAG: Flp1 family type IVb pilin, partial [Lachnospiraceae bacterium]
MRDPEEKNLQAFITEEKGIGTVEVILLLFVTIGLILVFKKQITALVENIFDSITA